MAKKVVVGIVGSRSEGMLYEQMLRDAGLRVESELGTAVSEFADVAPSKLYVDERDLNPETVRLIASILGKSVSPDLLQRYGVQPKADFLQAVAWFPTEEAAEEAARRLNERGYRTTVERWPWEVSPYENRPWALFLKNHDLDADTAKTIWEACGVFADANVLSPYRRFLEDG
ncbi:MAG: hypothetical protein KatS3mg015_0775 [Fimbriimonadales bacterium]|nr:MAG: hypothetical protein KatS3mg015_0775 [Fimbriimonadales bacterium]